MTAKAIMVLGTTSDAGKSFVAAALCRIFAQDGYKVAPFKSQNMALNSYITAEGLEMGRAQVMQAEACGIEPSVLMNPVLLKPTGDTGSQVIVLGEVHGDMPARDYYAFKEQLRPTIQKAYDTLAAQNDIIVLEGAGSPAEINLKQNDFVNCGMAAMAHAPIILVGDIDRGGVFASLYGTIKLLEPHEQAMIKGTVINRFRGDVSLLENGLDMLESLTDVPVVGVIPYMHVDLDDEDSLSGRLGATTPTAGMVDVAVIGLPHISNFTDFNPLGRFPGIAVRYVYTPQQLGAPDFLVVPGSKNTMSDLAWLTHVGLDAAIRAYAATGKPLLGVCGGYQMLGKSIADPDHTEGGGSVCGLGLLPVHTVFHGKKTRTRAKATTNTFEGVLAALSRTTLDGYEIHMGVSTIEEGSGGIPFAHLEYENGGGSAPDGCVYRNVMGTYCHGLMEEGSFPFELARMLCSARGLPCVAFPTESFRTYKNRQYDQLAQTVRASLDMDAIYRIVREGL